MLMLLLLLLRKMKQRRRSWLPFRTKTRMKHQRTKWRGKELQPHYRHQSLRLHYQHSQRERKKRERRSIVPYACWTPTMGQGKHTSPPPLASAPPSLPPLPLPVQN
jgi:hypothetical protein